MLYVMTWRTQEKGSTEASDTVARKNLEERKKLKPVEE